jgi:serine/threonine protein kinase
MLKKPFNLPPGRTLGSHYDIVEFLGAGWEGEVYRVRERKTGIERAAKLFFSGDKYSRAPILRYAQKLHNLKDCSIIIQYHHQDSAVIQGKKVEFLVSDIAEGEMLSKFLARQKRKRLRTFEALHLFYALVQGIEQIHFLKEYHGDIHSDNIMVKRRGLGFDVRLIDFLDLGRPSKEKIQYDIFLLMAVFYEIIGGSKYYQRLDQSIKQIILGKKSNHIARRFKTAGHVRLALDNLDWECP